MSEIVRHITERAAGGERLQEMRYYTKNSEYLFNFVIVWAGLRLFGSVESFHCIQYFLSDLWVCCCISRILGYIALAGGIRHP